VITAAQDMMVKAALGPDVLRVTQQIDCAMESGLRVPSYLWRELLATLNAHSPDLMQTVYGRVFIYLIEERINDNGSGSVRRRGGGFPSRRQF